MIHTGASQKRLEEMILKNISQAAAVIPCPERWLADGLRSGRFPGRKIARKWMLSDQDIAAILEICSATSTTFSAGTALGAPTSSMTPTTVRRIKSRR
jgi:hypothetical protein